MIRKTVILTLLIALGLSAELWVNAIRDPGAELGQGNWETDIFEWPTGAADSARVDAHDSSRAYEGSYSFLTDTDKYPGVDARVYVWCYQCLRVPKAVCDIDSCFWMAYVNENGTSTMWIFYILLRSEKRRIFWFCGRGTAGINDTVCSKKLPLPDSGEWTQFGVDFNNTWIGDVGWPSLDTIEKVELYSSAWEDLVWMGQEVSWDNIVLRSIAYYDYAAKSIDSEEQVGQSYTPIVTFANEGIKDDSSAMVYAEILEGETVVYKDSQEVSILAESSEQVEFSQWSVPHGGSYTLRVYPILGLDEYSADDTLEQALTGIEEGEGPAGVEFVTTRYSQSGILFSFTPGVSGDLSIYDVSGREVYEQLIQPGTQELLWITLSVPSGLYFYKLKAGERTSTGKLVVFK